MSVVELRARLAAGVGPGDLRAVPPRVARAVALATEVGAPVLPALAAAQAAEERARERSRALRVASAQGRTVAAGLALLPVVLVPGLARLLDLDLLAFYATPPGMLVAAAAGTLLLAGVLAVRVLVRRIGTRPPAGRIGPPLAAAAVVLVLWGPLPAAGVAAVAAVVAVARRRCTPPRVHGVDEVAQLVATAVTAGIGVPAALRAVVPHAPAHGDVLARVALALELDRTVPVAAPYDRLQSALHTSARWGAPVEPALRELADDLASEAHHRALEAVERLPALLTVPTALCLLPASILLVGAPLVAAGLAT